MPHIHTEPGQHDHTASAVIVRVDGPKPRVLLHKHKKLGVYMQFGGHIELDETPWQAIAHELVEESGYDFSQLQLLQPKDRMKHLSGVTLHPQPVEMQTHHLSDDHFHMDTLYAFTTDQTPAHKVAGNESSDFKLITRQELVDMPDDTMFPNMREICLYILDNCLPNWERVAPSLYE